MEMAPFGVEVVLVQLGGVLSALVDKSNSAQLPARFLPPASWRECFLGHLLSSLLYGTQPGCRV